VKTLNFGNMSAQYAAEMSPWGIRHNPHVNRFQSVTILAGEWTMWELSLGASIGKNLLNVFRRKIARLHVFLFEPVDPDKAVEGQSPGDLAS
jgi:hypothetical protein